MFHHSLTKSPLSRYVVLCAAAVMDTGKSIRSLPAAPIEVSDACMAAKISQTVYH
jgi:hypothetical protein